MITAIYAAPLALLVVWLSLRVVKLRRAKKVRLGDAGDSELQGAIRAQANAIEYIPLSLILLALLEMSGGHPVLLHAGGVAVVAGRTLHARGLLTDALGARVLGMQLTLFAIIGLALACLAYAGYSFLEQG
ncbi:MAPEG family protein [Halomonas sabkhae]|uniref:MAPEG family protein n=1 Tax=Halomonas sabkhae TaxID=626223 RepID=UPI0025B499AC|nr:MAPEG family protein [Halomonas sabkhae]MDN3526155.1 MAPEG family protein [Halomonas sabkhae]